MDETTTKDWKFSGTVLFATDHAGFEMKELLVRFVRDELGYTVEDFGASEYNPTDDYPDFIAKAARRVSNDPDNTRAIILGGSGQGEAMVANRFPKVRCMVFNSDKIELAGLSREHNDANIMSLGARFLTEAHAKEAVQVWLETSFTGEERHVRRIEKIEKVAP
jgi:ribose 5-phosphate isomerase B